MSLNLQLVDLQHMASVAYVAKGEAVRAIATPVGLHIPKLLLITQFMMLNLTENENFSFYEKRSLAHIEYPENVFAAGASPRISLRELTTLFQSP